MDHQIKCTSCCGLQAKVSIQVETVWLLVQVLLLPRCLPGLPPNPLSHGHKGKLLFSGWLTEIFNCCVYAQSSNFTKIFLSLFICPDQVTEFSSREAWDQDKSAPGAFPDLNQMFRFPDYPSTPRTLFQTFHHISFYSISLSLMASSVCGHTSHCGMQHLSET